MVWNNFADFLAMGGYAAFVWGAIASAALVLVLEPLHLRQRRQSLLARRQAAANLTPEKSKP